MSALNTHKLEALDVNVYKQPRRPNPVEVRTALRELHAATLSHMRTAGYVAAFRQLHTQLPELASTLLPVPTEQTQAHMEQVHAALEKAQQAASPGSTLSSLSGGADGVKFTSAQRAFMNSFYTLQLRALDAAHKCVRWATEKCVADGQRVAADLATCTARCGAWRAAWNEGMRPPPEYAAKAGDVPQDVVDAWEGPATPAFQQLAAQAQQLEADTRQHLAVLAQLQHEYDRAVLTHTQQVEQLKAGEIRKLETRAVPPELEAVSLKSYAAHVRDMLSSSPDMNLFF